MSNWKLQFAGLFKAKDVISRPPKENQASVLGGVCTFFFILGGLSIAIWRFTSLFGNAYYVANQRSAFADGNRRLALPNVLLQLDVNGSGNFDPNYLTLHATTGTVKNGMFFSVVDIPLISCDVSVSPEFSVQGYCLQNTSYVQGVFGSPVYEFLRLDIARCSSESIQHEGESTYCNATDEEIDAHLRYDVNSVSLWMNDHTGYDAKNWWAPVYQNIDKVYWTGLEVYFVTNIDTVDALWRGSYEEDYVSYHSYSMRFDSVEKYDGIFLSMYLRTNGQQTESDVHRYQLSTWVLEIGSIFALLGLFAKLIGGFTYSRADDKNIASPTISDNRQPP